MIVLLICLPGRALHAQTDSLVITAVPLREIANEAANDRQATRDILIEKVQVSTSYELIPHIDSLETVVAELNELTKQTMGTRLDYAYYSSLILRWERRKTTAAPLQETLQKYLAEVEEIGSGLVNTLAKWELTLEETDPSMLTEDIVSRIDGISHYIDSAQLILNDSLNSSLVTSNRVADIDLVIETNLHDLSELMKMELGRSILNKEESIFTIKESAEGCRHCLCNASPCGYGKGREGRVVPGKP